MNIRFLRRKLSLMFKLLKLSGIAALTVFAGFTPFSGHAESTRPYFARFTEKSCMPPGQAVQSLLVFGDSLSTPYQLEEGKGYARMLSQYFGVNLKNYAVNGAETGAVLSQVKSAVKAGAVAQGTISLVLAGGNDFLRNRKESETVKNLNATISELRAKGSRVVLVSVPSKNLMALTGVLSDNSLYENLWKSNQDVILLPNLVSSVLSDPKLKLDAVHPNEQGHLVLFNSLRYDLFAWSSYCHKIQTQ